MQQHGCKYFANSHFHHPRGGSEGQNISESSHVAYQIKVNGA